MRPANAPPAFQILAKPTGAVCNLDCKYCFFLSKEMLYPGSRFRMANELLETYTQQYIAAQQVDERQALRRPRQLLPRAQARPLRSPATPPLTDPAIDEASVSPFDSAPTISTPCVSRSCAARALQCSTGCRWRWSAASSPDSPPGWPAVAPAVTRWWVAPSSRWVPGYS